MASDLSETPTTGVVVQACGDAHISNFGLFSSPERRTVFDSNDFDAIPHYDVDFKQGSMEYDYDIDATTGAILQSHSEVDD